MAIIEKKIVSLYLFKNKAMKERDYFKQFDIHFGNFSFGKHCLDLEINNTFFEKHDNEDITGAKISVRLEIERKETLVILCFGISGTLYSTCDLCLEEISIPVAKDEKLILKIVPQPYESDDENIVFISEHTYSYNVEQILFEYLCTLIPMRKVHGEIGTETCNQNMLALIENAKVKPVQQEDARWEALKNIKLEDN